MIAGIGPSKGGLKWYIEFLRLIDRKGYLQPRIGNPDGSRCGLAYEAGA